LEGKVDSKEAENMSAGARRVIEGARLARTPDDADKRRVRQALALGLGAVVAGASSGTAVASATKAGALVGMRAILAAVAVLSAGTGTYLWVRGHERAPVVAPAAAPATTRSPVVEPIVTPPDPLLAELTLLREAQQALHGGAPRRALELAERHAALYPHSQLKLERGALRVFALCALGRKAEARSLATELLTAAPRSPLRTSLEESCATPTR
jgi:hypothetical protein